MPSKKNERLSETMEGQALLELLNHCGGNTALARALDVDTRTVNTWCHRGCISQQGAYRVAAKFPDTWTKEDVRPDLMLYQWEGEKPNTFGTFLRATKQDIQESKRRGRARIKKAERKARNKELEQNRELLDRVNQVEGGE